MRYNFNKFLYAQDTKTQNGLTMFEQAMSEMKRGHKTSHWIWYIFPQIIGLGHSFTSNKYAISCREEAKQYFEHPILGERLILAVNEILRHKDILNVLGNDAIKVRSCVTLFYMATKEPIFKSVIDSLFNSTIDYLTFNIIVNQTNLSKSGKS